VCKLQDTRAISAYLFECGLDDQNPEDWGDVDSLRAEGLVIPIVAGLSSDEEEGEGETEDEMEEEEEEEPEETEEKEPEETEEKDEEENAQNLVMPSPEGLSSSDEEEDEDEGVGQMEVTQRDLRARKRCRR
jgi:hypothetical protein